MRQRRVLSVLHSFHNRGGTEIHAKFLAESLGTDISTTFIAPHKGTIQIIDQHNAILETHLAPTIAFPETPIHQSDYELCFKNTIDSVKPDLVHVHHIMNWPLSIFKILNTSGIPWVLSLHDYYLITPHFTMQGMNDPRITLGPNYSKKLFGVDISNYLRERREFLRTEIRGAAKIVAPSKYMKRVFQSIFTEEVALIPHAIPPFSEKGGNAATRAFGYIGSFLPQKGISLLLEAYKLYRTYRGSWDLHLYGGDLGNDTVTSEGVVSHGVYTTTDLPQCASNFSVAILPSIFPETFCLTLSELWQLQKPVIAFAVGALSERFRSNPDGGWLVPTIDPKGLAEKMLEVEMLMSGTNSYEFSAEIPSVSSMTQRYKQIYNEVTHGIKGE